MNLEEIEAEADKLLGQMNGTNSAAQVRDICFRMEGLANAAQIKRIADQRAEWDAHVKLREAEIDAMHKAANAAETAVSAQQVGPCGDRAQTALAYSPPITCTLPAGHRGGHTDGTATWTHAEPCGQRLLHGTGQAVCGREHGHGGWHAGNGYEWKSAAHWRLTAPAADTAEPTKPAADRLHELVSYLAQQSEIALSKTEHVLQDSPPWKKHLAASKSYDDAATKLQEILSEGGI